MNRAGFRPQETEYQWDAHDRLVRITLPDGARWRYRYDAFGRRVSKAREGRVESARALMRVDYHWDGDQLVGQQQWLADGNAARAVQWVYEPGSFRPLAQLEQQNGATQLHYIVTDLTGTARELCSEEGDVHWRGEQALWGEYREAKTPMALRRWLGDAANDEVSCDLRYPGQLYDAESGLYYNRHRYYDPELGQYISPDPIGMLGGLRPQGYVHNPIEWVDPLGLTKASCADKALKEIHQKMKQNGKEVSVTVGSKEEAEDVLRGYISDTDVSKQGAFRNTTDQKLPSGKKSESGSDWLPGGKGAYEKQGTYHYDLADSNAKAGDHALLGEHLQIHTYEGKIIRIFY